jgi:hypothetical protein
LYLSPSPPFTLIITRYPCPLITTCQEWGVDIGGRDQLFWGRMVGAEINNKNKWMSKFLSNKTKARGIINPIIYQ